MHRHRPSKCAKLCHVAVTLVIGLCSVKHRNEVLGLGLGLVTLVLVKNTDSESIYETDWPRVPKNWYGIFRINLYTASAVSAEWDSARMVRYATSNETDLLVAALLLHSEATTSKYISPNNLRGNRIMIGIDFAIIARQRSILP